MKSNFLAEMKDRGYLNQCTDLDGLDELAKKKVRFWPTLVLTALQTHCMLVVYCKLWFCDYYKNMVINQ